MTDHKIDLDRLLNLTGTVCDENALQDEITELDSIVFGDRRACRNYLRYCRMHSALRFELRAHRLTQVVSQLIDIDPSDAAPGGLKDSDAEMPAYITPGFLGAALHNTIGFFSQELPFSLLIATLLTGFGLWIASLVYVSGPEKIAKDSLLPTKTSFDPTLKVVGKITGMADCKWSKNGRAPNGYDNVLVGRQFKLDSGLMEITYDTGAKVILQGPVSYEVESPNRGFLSVGKLVGKVENEMAQGFTIHTPTATITDLGTEFGVEVSPDCNNQVYVYKGKVRVEKRTSDPLAHRGQKPLSEKDSITLGEGKGIYVNTDGRVKQAAMPEVQSLARAFVRRISQADPLAYAKEVLADRPLLYWNFDEPEGPAFEQVRHLGRQALFPLGGAGRSFHSVIGSGLALGRAADFSRANGCFSAKSLLQQCEIRGAWAIEFWLQAAGKSGNRAGQYLLNIYGNPSVILNWSEPSPKDELQLICEGGARTHGGPILSDDRWHHVILIFYGDDKGLGVASRFDVAFDGELQTIERGGFSKRLDLGGTIVLGAATADLLRPFHGRVDELAFYDLSDLTVHEIEARMLNMARRHYRTAHQHTADAPVGAAEN